MRLSFVEDYADWDKFVRQSSDGTIFHTSYWYRAWGLIPKLMTVRDEGGRILSGHIVSERRRGFISFHSRPPFTQQNGPVVNFATTEGNCRIAESAREHIIFHLAHLPKMSLIDIKLSFRQQDLLPYLWEKYNFKPYYTYIIPPSKKETWIAHLTKPHRRNLKLSLQTLKTNSDLICSDLTISETYNVFAETANHGSFRIPSRDRMEKWWQHLKDRDSIRVYGYLDSNLGLIAVTLMVWDQHHAYYLLGGILNKVRAGTKANFALFDRMIRDAHDMGLAFDFEGSVLPGVERFFRGWGGDLKLMIRALRFSSYSTEILYNTALKLRSVYRENKLFASRSHAS